MAEDGTHMALAWGTAPAPQRGPKRAFALEQVLDAALTIADADGLDAVTMPSVASALGLTAMSLYRYVGSKDALVLLLQDHAMGPPPDVIGPGLGWRPGLEAYAAASTAVYRKHPWMLDIPIVGVARTPNNLAWFDAGLGTLAKEALTPEERMAIVLEVSGHARFRASVERGYDDLARTTKRSSTKTATEEARVLREVVDEGRLPHLSELLEAGALVSETFDGGRYALDRLLDGVEYHLAKPARTTEDG